MTRQQAIQNIHEVLNMGGSVTFPQKYELDDWIIDAQIGSINGEIIVFGTKINSIAEYVEEVLTNKNKIWQFRYIIKMSGNRAFEDISKYDVEAWAEAYINEQEALHKNGLLSI